MTQTQVASKCNVTFQQIQKYEKGINTISLYRALQIAYILKINLNDLLKDTEITEIESVTSNVSKTVGVNVLPNKNNSTNEV